MEISWHIQTVIFEVHSVHRRDLAFEGRRFNCQIIVLNYFRFNAKLT